MGSHRIFYILVMVYHYAKFHAGLIKCTIVSVLHLTIDGKITNFFFHSTGSTTTVWKLFLTDNLQESLDILQKHEIHNTLRFVAYCTPKDFGNTGILNALNYLYLTLNALN